MLPSEEIAKNILDEWIAECRSNNSSGQIELKDVSNWVEKRHEINKNCPNLDSPDGAFLLFCLGSLLSFGGGNYDEGWSFSKERKARFAAIDLHLRSLMDLLGPSNFLQKWWETKKETCSGDLNKAAESMLNEIHNWSYETRDGKRSLFTVKVFWIPRELHANNIWSDFPVEYCCIPDRYVKNMLCELYGRARYEKMFGIKCGIPSFNLDSSILMSKKVCELVSRDKVDGYYPYDLPFFRKGYICMHACLHNVYSYHVGVRINS